MAQLNIDTDALLSGWKTQTAGLGIVLAGVLGYKGILDPVTSIMVANALIGLGFVFLRRALKKVEGPINSVLAQIPDTPGP